MSVFNDLRFLPQALGSILAQTLPDFDFVIIDDDATDGSGEYLHTITDSRVRVIRNPLNLGLTRSLNIGLQHCQTEFIARMDGDDIAHPDRLRVQLAFMQSHPDIGILGTARQNIDESGSPTGIATPPASDADIRWKCLLGNPFAHPTVMLRRDVLQRHGLRYNESFRSAQDYELWTRLLMHTRGANLTEPLLQYRQRSTSISRTRRDEQLANHDRIAHAAIGRLVPDFPISLDDVRELRGRFGGFSVRDPQMDPADPIWVDRLARLRDAFDVQTARLAA
jgi:glycosyltransferase involved in cell wall biosynthesis